MEEQVLTIANKLNELDTEVKKAESIFFKDDWLGLMNQLLTVALTAMHTAEIAQRLQLEEDNE